jgi:hypothetical protein
MTSGSGGKLLQKKTTKTKLIALKRAIMSVASYELMSH